MAMIPPAMGIGDPIEERKRKLLERLAAGRGGRRNVAGGQKFGRGGMRGRGAPILAGAGGAGRFNRPFGAGGVHPGLAGLSVAQENIPLEHLPPQLGGGGFGPPMGEPEFTQGGFQITPSATIGTMQGYGGAPEWFDILRLANYGAGNSRNIAM